MSGRMTTIAAAALATLLVSPAPAANWILSKGESKIAFGSIKTDTVGEAHHFTNLGGSITDAGNALIEIDVSSLETWIDIRNQRMLKHVFDEGEYPIAVIEAQVDMAEVASLEPGQTTTVSTTALLEFVGADVEMETDLFVAALSNSKVMVTTDEMILLSTEDLGIDEGVDQLMELAQLPSITRVTPVTLRLVFEKR